MSGDSLGSEKGKDTFSRGGSVALSGPITTWSDSVVAPETASVPCPASAVRHDPVPESAQGAVAPLPEVGARAGLSVQNESRWQRRGDPQRNGRPVGPTRPALLPVARWERAVYVRSSVIGH